MTEVAVTGIGVTSALGHGVEALWRGLVTGRSGLRPIERFPVSNGAWGGEVPPLDLHAVARTSLGRRIDRTSLLALAAARFALADAGLDPAALDPARTGLALASALGNLGETAAFLDRLFLRGAANPLVFPNLVMNAPLSYASIELGVTGPTAMLSEQEASGEAAIAWGAGLVADGVVDVCLAGAADELDAVRYQVLSDAGAITARTPRLFDPAGDGGCPGEGSALLVLESLPRARARRAHAYARLVASPSAGVPAPVHGWPTEVDALAAAVAPVVADADLVIAGASGSPTRDLLEVRMLRELGELGALPSAAVTAPRGAIGDFGSAGALGVAVAALAIAARCVPPTLGVAELPAGLDLVTGDARPRRVHTAVAIGLARGGFCQPLRLEVAA